MRFVLDSSLALAWCFADEQNSYAEHALCTLATGEALVPSLWALEVANALLVGERRGRLSSFDTARAVAWLYSLPISVDMCTHDRALREILELARREGLTSYDAAYLELAMREGVPIASLDEKLQSAARKSGVKVLQV